MKKFLDVLGNTAIGSALKVGFGAVLVWVLENVTTFDLPPVLVVFIVAATPSVINWLNPEDPRYGRDGYSDEVVAD